MGLTNCQICGKAFLCTGGRPICPECRDSEEKDFEKVRDFVKDNPKVSIEVVVEGTGVSSEKIRRYLNEGLLEQANLTEKNQTCQLCHKSITAGNYCIDCMSRLKNCMSPKEEEEKKEKEKKQKTSFSMNYRNRKR